MSRYFSIIGLVVAAAHLCAASAPPSTPSTPDKIVAEATRVLNAVKDTHYQHKTEVDESKGAYAVDCSGLVCFVLKRVSPKHLEQIPHPGFTRPVALNFYDMFHDQRPGWKYIERAIDAKPGDLIAWRKIEQKAGDTTGHVMIIIESAVMDGGKVKLQIIDSAKSGHGDDTRDEGKDGVGRGTIWLDVDAAGRPTAYHWKSAKGEAHEIPIAIGRAIEIDSKPR